MVNVATLDVCCFINQQFEAHVGQECCQSIMRFPHVADVEISGDQCWLVHFNVVQKMINQVLHSAISGSVDVEELNFLVLITIFVQKGSLTYLQLRFTYYCKNFKGTCYLSKLSTEMTREKYQQTQITIITKV